MNEIHIFFLCINRSNLLLNVFIRLTAIKSFVKLSDSFIQIKSIMIIMYLQNAIDWKKMFHYSPVPNCRGAGKKFHFDKKEGLGNF